MRGLCRRLLGNLRFRGGGGEDAGVESLHGVIPGGIERLDLGTEDFEIERFRRRGAGLRTNLGGGGRLHKRFEARVEETKVERRRGSRFDLLGGTSRNETAEDEQCDCRSAR